jgi:hypothetical protein
MNITFSIVHKMYRVIFMNFYKVDISVYSCYNDSGKDFEGLLAEAIRQVNLENIHKQIITSNAASRKEASHD